MGQESTAVLSLLLLCISAKVFFPPEATPWRSG